MVMAVSIDLAALLKLLAFVLVNNAVLATFVTLFMAAFGL